MTGSQTRLLVLSFVVAGLASGCSEVRGRRLIQQGNKLYKEGNYEPAIKKFEEAEKYVPDFWILWLNKGYTCRQMIIPAAQSPEQKAKNKKHASCALAAFSRLKELRPEDNRGEVLYVQTLFDAEEFENLTKMYEERFQQNPRDEDAITGLIQVYSKWKKMDEALEWYMKKAEVKSNDAEAPYAVGVFIWQQLTQKGGGPDKSAFVADDPKKRAAGMPMFGYGDIVSQQRIDLADRGIEYLAKALVIRPKFHDAMTYTNLLYRQKSFAFFDQPDEWRKNVNLATDWARKSLETQGKPIPAGFGKIVPRPADEEDPADETAAPAEVKPGKKAPAKKQKKGKRRK